MLHGRIFAKEWGHRGNSRGPRTIGFWEVGGRRLQRGGKCAPEFHFPWAIFRNTKKHGKRLAQAHRCYLVGPFFERVDFVDSKVTALSVSIEVGGAGPDPCLFDHIARGRLSVWSIGWGVAGGVAGPGPGMPICQNRRLRRAEIVKKFIPYIHS
jgi:hypothetical protein